jgi:ATP-dependent RNA helicase DDX5/DBP2
MDTAPTAVALAVPPNNSTPRFHHVLTSSGSYSSGQSNGYSNSYSTGRSNGYSGGSGYDSYGAGGDKMANMGAGLQKPSFDLDTLPKFEKNFYHEAATVKQRSDREIEDFRNKKEIRVAGKHIPRPVETFEEAGFPGMSLYIS